MYAVVDVYGAVTSVSLCTPVIDLSQSGTATVSHSLTNMLSPTDETSVGVCSEPADANDVTMELVGLLTDFL